MQKITRNIYFRFEKYVPKLMKPIPTYKVHQERIQVLQKF